MDGLAHLFKQMWQVPDMADSFVKASNITKTRHAHQVTSTSLYALLQTSTESADSVPFEDWCVQRASHSTQFDYWLKTLSLEILLLLYVRSIREGDFQLYIESLTKLMPQMFALDHMHYARWLTIHIRDMMALPSKHAACLQRVLRRKVRCTNQHHHIFGYGHRSVPRVEKYRCERFW